MEYKTYYQRPMIEVIDLDNETMMLTGSRYSIDVNEDEVDDFD